jgi:hypothetical protein
MRGKVARTQINNVEIIRVSRTNRILSINKILVFPIIITDVIRLIARILVYSAIKINAKEPLLYSTLKPETSSDSPSAKSKGVRLVSARFVINHNIITNGIINSKDLR